MLISDFLIKTDMYNLVKDPQQYELVYMKFDSKESKITSITFKTLTMEKLQDHKKIDKILDRLALIDKDQHTFYMQPGLIEKVQNQADIRILRKDKTDTVVETDLKI